MPRHLSSASWKRLEALARIYCEKRSDYQARKQYGALNHEFEQGILLELSILDREIEMIKNFRSVARGSQYRGNITQFHAELRKVAQ
jgi:hypothetical protein